MQDRHGRTINYLRVSLTDLCNFRCRYCMPPGGVNKLRHEEILTLEELYAVVKLMVTELGFDKVRVTGGEPLIRRGAPSFLKDLGAIEGIKDLSLTTNAYHLAERAEELKAAGFRRVNISLDTLRADRFAALTGVDGLERVLAGIEAARRVGFAPIKINVVSLRETRDEILDLITFGLEKGVEIRFIELMPIQGGPSDQYLPNERVRDIVAGRHELRPIERGNGKPGEDAHSAAQRYHLGDTGAAFGLISSVTHPFCASCNRIRLRADGYLKPCLASKQSYDLRKFVRPRLRAEELVRYVQEVTQMSKEPTRGDYEIDTMSAFGG